MVDVTEFTQKRRLAKVQTLDAISVPPRQQSDRQLPKNCLSLT